jgi:hypothetical protein
MAQLSTSPPTGSPTTKRLVVIQGKGTAFEKRIETGITLYWCATLGRWVSIPE